MPLGLFVVGWLVYSVGFIWSLISKKLDTADPSHDPSDAVHFPYYVALIGGPVIYVSGSLHAILSGAASALVGIFVAFLNVVYFSSVSWVMYNRGLNISINVTTNTSFNIPASSDAKNQAWMMFEGTLFALICWCFLQILAVFYKNPEDQNTNRRSQDCLSTCTRSVANKRPFPGAARLISVLFLILSVIGWCLFVVGYYQWSTENNSQAMVVVFDNHTEPVIIAVFIIGPLLYLASLLHAGCSGRTSTMSVFTAVLHVLYVVSSGFIITHLSLHIIRLKSTGSSATKRYIDYMLGGCMASLLFWTFIHALRPFYQDFHGSGVSRMRGAVGDLNEPPESTSTASTAGGSSPPDYRAATAQIREGNHETQPLLAQ